MLKDIGITPLKPVHNPYKNNEVVGNEARQNSGTIEDEFSN